MQRGPQNKIKDLRNNRMVTRKIRNDKIFLGRQKKNTCNVTVETKFFKPNIICGVPPGAVIKTQIKTKVKI